MAGIDSLEADLQPYAQSLVDAAAHAGLGPRVTSGRRSQWEQARLYRNFLAGGSPYPVAPPGHSTHEVGLAFDMVVEPMAALQSVGGYWESMGGVWGGRIGDPIHFESANAQAVLASASPPILGGGLTELEEKYAPAPLKSFIEAVSLPERALVAAIEQIPGLETLLSFFGGPASIPLSVIQLLKGC